MPIKIRFAIGLAILLIQLFLYISAESIYGPYANLVKGIMLSYFILLAVLSPVVLPMFLKISFKDLPNFTYMFIITAVLMLAFGSIGIMLTGEIEKSLQLALGFGFLHCFVKAFDEELIFRGALPKIMGNNKYSELVANIIFGIFHFGVLMTLVAMGNLTIYVALANVMVLIGLGYIWSQIAKRFGIMGSTGSHFAFNLAQMGVLVSVI